MIPPEAFDYIMALVYFSRVCSCVAISQAFKKYSHDKLTRMLNGNWSQQRLLDRAVHFLFNIAGGVLLLDDTVIEKKYAQHFAEASWVYSSKERKAVYGISVVLLVWSCKEYKIPLAFRVWSKGKGKPSKQDLALELLSYARNQLKLKPEFVLMDSWYSSKKILKRIEDYGWGFISQLKKNRNFEGVQLKKYKPYPYWNEIGLLTGGLKVMVVRHRNNYYVSNRVSLDAKEMREYYVKR
jgi:putative transposase